MTVQPSNLQHAGLLPQDWQQALLLGRADLGEGPTPILVREGRVLDVSRIAPTTSAFLEKWNGVVPEDAKDLGDIAALDFQPVWLRDSGPKLLAPVDLQCVKAAGVTFAVSAVERVIEERAQGKPEKAQAIREALSARVGTDLRAVVPGSPESVKLKAALISDGLWSQYLEVAIGPDAEVFTKAPPLSSVGWGAHVGIRTQSTWNNPEPEIVMVCDRAGRVLGATLGNDVNLRDYEGRSALLLGKAKDNNAASAVGPFIRLFDSHYTIDDVRGAVVELEIQGGGGGGGGGPGQLPAGRQEHHGRDQPRSAGTGAPDHQRASISRRLRAVPGNPVRAHTGP